MDGPKKKERKKKSDATRLKLQCLLLAVIAWFITDGLCTEGCVEFLVLLRVLKYRANERYMTAIAYMFCLLNKKGSW